MLPVFIIPTFLSYTLNNLSKKIIYPFAVLLTLLIVIFYFPMFKPKDWFPLSDSQKLSGELLKRQLTASIYDYLPVVAKKAPDDVPGKDLESIDGDFTDLVFEKGTNWYRINIEVLSDTAKVALPSYDYPIWKVFIDKKDTDLVAYGDYGLVSFSVGSGVHQIIAKQEDTPLKVISDSISLLSLAGFIGFCFYHVVREHPGS